MATLPKFPLFKISETPQKDLINIAVEYYSYRFEELRTCGYKVSKVISSKVMGEIWTFYQFTNNESHKYLVKLKIYSAQFDHCEPEDNPRNRIYGPYDGLIDEIIKDRENLKISKYQNDNSYKSNIHSIINEMNDLKLRELKAKCKEMELKIKGNKDDLVYAILNKILKFEELI